MSLPCELPSDWPLLAQCSVSFLSALSPEVLDSLEGGGVRGELGLPVLGVNGGQAALGTRNPDLSPDVDSFLSDCLEYGLKLDLSSAPMSLSFSGPDFASLSEAVEEPVTEDNLEGVGSGFPIWEQVWARRARGLFLASSSMGLTGVEGRGCRYSGWRMCPLRAVSILSTLMGSRPAWRRGSLGGTACTNARLLAEADPLLVPELSLLSGTAGLTRLAEASGEQIMSPTQALG